MIRSIAFVVAASVIAASCSNSPGDSSTPTTEATSTTVGSTAELVERVSSSVVRLDVTACDGEYVGAGFLIDETHIVTVAHNVVGAESVIAELGDEVGIPQLIGVDEERDIALLRSDIPMGSVYLDLEGGESAVGDDLFVFGFPLGLDLTVTRGILSNANVELEGEPLLRSLQIDAAASPGNSGGPVVNGEGELVGILRSGMEGYEGLNFATKVSSIARLVESWIGNPNAAFAECANSVATSTDSAEKPDDREIKFFCMELAAAAGFFCSGSVDEKKLIGVGGAIKDDESSYVASVKYTVVLNGVPFAGPYLEVENDSDGWNFGIHIEDRFDFPGVYSVEAELKFASGDSAFVTTEVIKS